MNKDLATYTESELYALFDEFLDDVHGTVQVAGHHYDTSRLLKDADPIAYRCGFVDWLASEGYEEHSTLDDVYTKLED